MNKNMYTNFAQILLNSWVGKLDLTSLKIMGSSGIPDAETFGRKGKFSTLGFRFRPPKLKAEYGRNLVWLS